MPQVFLDDSVPEYYTRIGGVRTQAKFTELDLDLSLFTIGSVFFSNGVTLAEDNSNLFWDDINNRLGILTNSPSFPLDVTGNARFTGTLFAANARVASIDDSIATSNAGINFGGASKFINFETDATERMRIDSAGAVGIGITSGIDGLLHVHSGSAGIVSARAAGDELVIENSTNGGMSILTPDTNTSTIIFGSPSDPLGADIKWNHDNDVFIIGTRKTDSTLRFVTGSGTTALNINKNQNFDFQDGILTTLGTIELGHATDTTLSRSAAGVLAVEGTDLLQADGSVPLTANWDAGEFDISMTEVRLLEPSGGGTSYTGFKAPALAGNVLYTLPIADGNASDFLQTNGSAVLAWAAISGSAASILARVLLNG